MGKPAAADITQRLDRLPAVEESRLEPAFHRAQRESLGGEDWAPLEGASMRFRIEVEREDDGRWIAEVPALLGVMVYGADRDAAVARVQALALRVLRERLESGDAEPELLEAIEDVALGLAIREGESSGVVSREEVFRALGCGE